MRNLQNTLGYISLINLPLSATTLISSLIEKSLNFESSPSDLLLYLYNVSSAIIFSEKVFQILTGKTTYSETNFNFLKNTAVVNCLVYYFNSKDQNVHGMEPLNSDETWEDNCDDQLSSDDLVIYCE